MRYIAIEREEVEKEWMGSLIERIGTNKNNYDYGICRCNHVFTMDEMVILKRKGDQITAYCPVVVNEKSMFKPLKICGQEILFMYAQNEYNLQPL